MLQQRARSRQRRMSQRFISPGSARAVAGGRKSGELRLKRRSRGTVTPAGSPTAPLAAHDQFRGAVHRGCASAGELEAWKTLQPLGCIRPSSQPLAFPCRTFYKLSISSQNRNRKVVLSACCIRLQLPSRCALTAAHPLCASASAPPPGGCVRGHAYCAPHGPAPA